MDTEKKPKKPWQPIWLPVLIVGVVAVSVFVFMAPPELQKGFLPGVAPKAPETFEATLLNTKSVPCSAVSLQPYEVCQDFDIEVTAPDYPGFTIEKIYLKTPSGGVIQEMDENFFRDDSPKKIYGAKPRSRCEKKVCVYTYAFRAVLPEGMQIGFVDFAVKNGRVFSVSPVK